MKNTFPRSRSAHAFKRLAVLACICLLAACHPKPYTTRPFSPPDNSFTVRLPDTPKEELFSGNPAKGLKGKHFYLLRQEQWLYSAGYTEYETRMSDMSEALDRGRDSVLGSGNRTLRSEQMIRLDGNAGREVIIDGERNTTMRLRMFSVGNRFYMVLISTPKEDANSARIDDFLNSFHLNPT